MEKAYPAWAERQRSALRQAMALGFSVERLNLPYLQGDLAADNRANKPYYNQGQSQGQNQGQGQSQSHSQGQSQGQRPKRPKKGKKRKSNSSGGSSNGPNNSESKYGTSNPSENQAHSFLMGSYSLELNNSSSEGEFNSDSDSDSSVESDPFFHENRANRPKKSGKTKGKKACKHHKFDALLYDTGSTDHIINDRKWFVEFDSDKGKLPVLTTGGGPVTPQGRGKALFRVKAEPNKGYYITLTLQNALYLPNLDVNIVSGQKHYKAGGVLIKETLYGTDKKPCGALNVKKHGFFLTIEGKKPPIVNTLAYCHMVRQARELQPVRDRLVIELPEKPNIRPKEYVEVPTTPEPEDVQ